MMAVIAEQFDFTSNDRKVVDLEPILGALPVKKEYRVDGMPVLCKVPYMHIHTLVYT